jgi:hypothetical protein
MTQLPAVTAGMSLLPSVEEWQTMTQMAEALVASGLLPKHITTWQAALAVMQRGRELGVPPMYALSNILHLQGKPTANSELMLALIYRDHGDGAVIFTHTDETRCEVSYKRRGWTSRQRYAFTLEDAKRAGLLNNPSWLKYPAAMLRARSISAVARMAFPDSIGGMYTPEELGAEVEVDAEGQLVVVSPGADTVDGATGESLPSATEAGLDAVHILRIVTEAQECVDEHHRARVRQLHAEAVRLGIREEPAVEEALSAAKARCWSEG